MTNLYIFHFSVELISAIFWSCWAATFLSVGFSLSNVAILLASMFLAQALFEVPTGMMADKYGRKKLTILGLLIVALGFALIGFGHKNISTSVVGFFISGIGFTAVSGAKASWLYSVCEYINPSFEDGKQSKIFFLLLHLVGRIAYIVGAFGGVFLYSKEALWFWVVAAIVSIVSALLGLIIKDPSKYSVEAVEHEIFSIKKLVMQVKSPVLFYLILSICFFGIEVGTRNLVYQPYVIHLSKGNEYFLAYFQAILSVSRLLGIIFYLKFRLPLEEKRNAYALIFPLLYFGVVQLISYTLNSFWVYMLIYSSAIFTLGWFFPLRDHYINSIVNSKNRATLLSFDSMAMNALAALSLLIVSGYIDLNQVRQLWLVGGCSLLVSAYYLFRSENEKYRSNLMRQ